MDRAPRPPQPDAVDEERRHCDAEHEQDPDPADRAMRNGTLRCHELDEAQRKRRECRERMDLDDRSGVRSGPSVMASYWLRAPSWQPRRVIGAFAAGLS